MRSEACCPGCGWRLEMLPCREVYEYNTLDLWEGCCSNPRSAHEGGCSAGLLLPNGRRVIRPSEAVVRL